MEKCLLQERIMENQCTVLNYTSGKILVDYFANEEMYEKYLEGINCRKGMGMYDINQELFLNRLPDGYLVIIKHDDVEVQKYKYVTLFKSTLIYLEKGTTKEKSKKRNKVFKIRENKFDNQLNLLIDDRYLDFNDIEEVKSYMQKEYPGNFIEDKGWGDYL